MLLQPVVFQSLQDKDQKMKTCNSCNYSKFLIYNGFLMFYFILQLISDNHSKLLPITEPGFG